MVHSLWCPASKVDWCSTFQNKLFSSFKMPWVQWAFTECPLCGVREKTSKTLALSFRAPQFNGNNRKKTHRILQNNAVKTRWAITHEHFLCQAGSKGARGWQLSPALQDKSKLFRESRKRGKISWQREIRSKKMCEKQCGTGGEMQTFITVIIWNVGRGWQNRRHRGR